MEDNLYFFLMHVWWTVVSTFLDLQLPPLALLFLKSSRSCVPLLCTPFTSAIYPLMASWRRQFLRGIWPIQLTFLRWKWPLLSYSPRTCSLVTFSDNFILFIFLQHYISKLSKDFRSNFLSIQVSEP